ncbi:MAG: DegT/DnrJ/EryC1/StrS family aminotransferase [Alphaproteobacteria bacterium]|nr:DegT/DnrJ/EryC1/StrS family aminotransferase [Alphaproteobacteria bacterium]
MPCSRQCPCVLRSSGRCARGGQCLSPVSEETASVRNIPFGRPMIGEAERAAVAEVLNGPILVHGPRAVEFERGFSAWTGAPHSISVSSCTAALHLCYFHLGLGPGDEVIVPAQTHVATAHAVELMGAKPVFVDAERRTGNIDIDAIEAALTSRTRVISIVHYLGVPVDMARINALAKKRNLFVLEDCALAIGTRLNGIHAGLHGNVGCFSFYPVKHMTTAEGGMITTRNGEIAAKLTRQKAFGVDRHMGERKVPGVYDVTMLGFNYRMSEIEAALGIAQLTRLNDMAAVRRRNYNALSRALRELDEIEIFADPPAGFESSYYCLAAFLRGKYATQRFEIVSRLNALGVGTSVYYPKPVPHLTYYREKYGYRDDTYPNAAWISNSAIALPVGPHLDLDDMSYIAQSLKTALSETHAC